ncbi:unnamed protein product [Cercospora beticola]|nr:unnamed protein product [Cercospora beticola]
MPIITEQDRVRMGTVASPLAKAVEQRAGPAVGGEHSEWRQRRADHLAKLRHLYPIPGPIPDQVHEKMGTIRARDGYQIPVRIYKPVRSVSKSAPVIVMLHEGGWTMGDLTDEDLNCRMFARDIGALCINVDYRLGPEHPWPKCVEDCYDVVTYIAKTASPQSSELPGDPTAGFIVGGSSAGGNLAAVMSQMTRDDGMKPAITGQYLSVPSLLWWDAVPEKWKSEYRSRKESINDPLFGDKFVTHAPPNFAGEGSTDTRFNPLLHPDLAGLPACYLQVAGLDPLRDEALIYESVLRENRVKTRLEVYDGYGHMFWTNWPELDRSTEYVQDTLAGFKWLLGV